MMTGIIMIYIKYLFNVRKICLSDRCIAYIGSGMLTDFKLITENDRSRIIEKSKVRRMRSKARKENRNIERFSSLYFDGKRDNTLMKNGRLKKQEHYTP